MIVPCPYCSTRYSLDDARLAGPSPMLKCSRCKRVFPAPRPKKQAVERPPGKATADEENLTLPFDEPGWKDEPPAPSGDLTIPGKEERYTLGTDEPADDLVVPPDTVTEPAAPAPEDEPRAALRRPAEPSAPDPLEGDDLELEHDELEIVAEETEPAAAVPAAPRRPPQRRGSRGGASRPSPPPDTERGKVWALMVFLAAVLASYGMLTRALFASPQLCDRLLSRVPLISALTDQRLLTRKVALSEVSGGYQRIKDGKQVFVISGKALNTAPVALHNVQIAGKLFNDAGQELDEKVIFCGNSITIKMLKDMTLPGISILQGLRPAKGSALEPGESSPFVIVFMDPPHQAAEFTTQVTAAQHHI